jgi:hypothetical protein
MRRAGAVTVVAAAVIAAVLAPFSGATARTTSPAVLVNVHVTITDKGVIMKPKTAPRGSDARFVIQNIGKKPHSFTLGTVRKAGLPTGFTRIFGPKSHAIFVLYLEYRGPLQYEVDKGGKGLDGVFLVGDTCALCNTD